jgi:hypothetical protein
MILANLGVRRFTDLKQIWINQQNFQKLYVGWATVISFKPFYLESVLKCAISVEYISEFL